MKTLFAVFAFALTSLIANAASGWSTDVEAALKKAKAENKNVLLQFTGSDWCPPCQYMHKNVFTKSEFTSTASKDFILVELDFPRGDKKVSKANEPYAKTYSIEAFPTVVLLNSKGKEYERFTATTYRTVDTFLAHLAEVKK